MPEPEIPNLLDAVTQAASQSDWRRALSLLLFNWSDWQDRGPLCERVASVLVEMGKRRYAIEVYERLALRYASKGESMRSLVALKHLLDLQPDRPLLLEQFSGYFCANSPYLSQASPPTARPQSYAGLVPTALLKESNEELVQQLMQRVLESSVPALPERGSLFPVPLLAELTAVDVQRLIPLLEFKRFEQDSTLESWEAFQGSIGWTATTNFRLTHAQKIYSLPPVTMLGLNQLMPGASTSQTSTVCPKGSEMLWIPGDKITELRQNNDSVFQRLRQLCRRACAARVVRNHPLFSSLSENAREDVFTRLSGFTVPEGSNAFSQGHDFPGIVFLIQGTMDLVRKDKNWEILVGSLKPGDSFGECGMVWSPRSPIDAVARTSCDLLLLDKSCSEDLMTRWPTFREFVTKVASTQRELFHNVLEK